MTFPSSFPTRERRPLPSAILKSRCGDFFFHSSSPPGAFPLSRFLPPREKNSKGTEQRDDCESWGRMNAPSPPFKKPFLPVASRPSPLSLAQVPSFSFDSLRYPFPTLALFLPRRSLSLSHLFLAYSPLATLSPLHFSLLVFPIPLGVPAMSETTGAAPCGRWQQSAHFPTRDVDHRVGLFSPGRNFSPRQAFVALDRSCALSCLASSPCSSTLGPRRIDVAVVVVAVVVDTVSPAAAGEQKVRWRRCLFPTP